MDFWFKIQKIRVRCINYLRTFPFVVFVKAKYPVLFKIIVDRFRITKFSELPLTMLFIAFVGNLFLLSEIIEKLENSKLLYSIDHGVARIMFNIRNEELAKIVYLFSLAGSVMVLFFVALAAIIIYFISKRTLFILPVLTSLCGTGITVWIGKIFFQRIRPDDYSYYKEVSYSFPSGHATVAVAFYGMLFFSIIRSVKANRSKFYWFVIAVIFIGLLGFSRIYLCVHYLSDVAAGYSLGFLWLLLAISIYEWKTFKKNISENH